MFSSSSLFGLKTLLCRASLIVGEALRCCHVSSKKYKYNFTLLFNLTFEHKLINIC